MQTIEQQKPMPHTRTEQGRDLLKDKDFMRGFYMARQAWMGAKVVLKMQVGRNK